MESGGTVQKKEVVFRMKKLTALLLALAMLCSLVSVAAAETESEPIVIRWGTHWADGLDPHKINETTGEYCMSNEDDRLLRIEAEKAVLEKYNVQIEYVQYAQDTRSELVLSVLAGNPVCDIALMWNGSENTVLAQNILQPLDDYTELFDGADWMLPDPVYGHNYFLNSNVSFNQYFPLLVNMTMLEKVDALKDENGRTIYPTDLLEQDKWTWSVFEDYLAKIQAYYANTPAPDGAKVSTVQAYETDHRFATLAAVYSNGGAIYGAKGLQVDSEETIEAVNFIRTLREKGLMVDCGVYDDGYTPQWCESGYDFGRGATVFAECPSWHVKGQVDACTARGESVALMPWPRPDDVAKDSDEYRQVISVGDCWGVLKGVDSDTAKLALESFRLYWETYYNLKGGVENMDEYKTVMSETTAMNDYGLDILNETYGEGILNAFIFNAQKCVPNDFASLLGMRDAWDAILGKGFYGVDGMPSYDVAIAANLSEFTTTMTKMEAILGSTELNDNQAPEVSTSGKAVIALGTDLETVDFSQYFTAKDGFDGVLDPAMGTFRLTDVDVNTVGEYKLKGIYADKAGNEGSAKVQVVVYDPANTVAPTLTVKAELPTVAMDSDTADIKWADDYVETAQDASGLDLKDNVTADLSELDTTMPGDYNVTLTVTDYAGNTATADITVTVVAE